MAQTNVFANKTATTSEGNFDMSVHNVYFIANDAVSGDLLLAFDESMATNTNYMVIKPGESFKEMNMGCATLYYKSTAGSVAFRCYGQRF